MINFCNPGVLGTATEFHKRRACLPCWPAPTPQGLPAPPLHPRPTGCSLLLGRKERSAARLCEYLCATGGKVHAWIVPQSIPDQLSIIASGISLGQVFLAKYVSTDRSESGRFENPILHGREPDASDKERLLGEERGLELGQAGAPASTPQPCHFLGHRHEVAARCVVIYGRGVRSNCAFVRAMTRHRWWTVSFCGAPTRCLASTFLQRRASPCCTALHCAALRCTALCRMPTAAPSRRRRMAAALPLPQAAGRPLPLLVRPFCWSAAAAPEPRVLTAP